MHSIADHPLLRALLSCAAIALALPAGSDAATLVALDTIGSESPGFALPPAALVVPVTAIRLRIGPVVPPAASYRVLAAGPDAQLQTADCASLPVGDDTDIAITEVLAPPASPDEVVLRVAPAAGLAAGPHRVMVCAATARATRALAPTQIADLRIAETPQLPNPDFATSIDGWDIVAGPGRQPDVRWSAIDADAAAASGSLRITLPAQRALLLRSRRCVMLDTAPASAHLRARTRYRYRVLRGTVAITAHTQVGFAPDQGEPTCIGPVTGESTTRHIAGAAEAFATHDSGAQQFDRGPLASLLLVLQNDGDTDAEALLDDIGLGFDAAALFRAGFESRH